MARPRKPGDPARWPLPCVRCNGHYEISANWPDGGICGYCYQQAKRTRGICACGHEGVLPGRIDSAPACRRCSGVKVNVDCAICGREDELYGGGRCWHCELAVRVDQVLAHPETGGVRPELGPLADALKAMKRANSGVTWIRQGHVDGFLRALAAAPAISHEVLDDLPGVDRTRSYVRGLLVEHDVLPERDERAIRYGHWAAAALDRLQSDEHRDVIRRYVRWYHQRRMNEMAIVPDGTYLRSKQSVSVAIDFLNWLHDHSLQLDKIAQEHVDAWIADGPTTRKFLDRFLPWAVKSQLVRPDLQVMKHRRGSSSKMSKSDQDDAVERVVHTEELTVRDRAAAILVIVFGQQIEDVIKLTWDDIAIADDAVTVALGKTQFVLPSPLDRPFRELADVPVLTAAHPRNNWVFRGYSPGRHITGASLRISLKAIFATRAARLGTLHELTKVGPVPIVADALGYSTTTIERHASGSAAVYSEYIASIKSVDAHGRLH